jgi:hypothetical protein
MAFKDPEFEAAAQTIRQWWTAAAGSPGSPSTGHHFGNPTATP